MHKKLIILPWILLISCTSSKQFNETPELWLGITSYESGWTKERGEYDSAHKPHPGRTGIWEEFYEKLIVKARGKYEFDFFEQCCTGSICDQVYSYKVGEWIYYHRNGTIKARGKFKIRKKKIETSCDGGEYINAGYVTNKWKFYDEYGNRTKPDPEFIQEIEDHSYFIDWGN